MEVIRKELMPGVYLNCVRSDKFKSSYITLSLLSQLQREAASMNALIPFVLRRGTTAYPDIEHLNNRFDELYGTVIEPLVRRSGEIQSVGFACIFPEGRFLPQGENILGQSVSLLCDVLLNPLTRGGLLLPAYVESERDKLIDLIRSRVNNKRGYSITRCIEEMCCYEDFSVGKFGSENDCEEINYKKLTRHYREMLQTAPVEIFYCGNDSAAAVTAALKDSLCTMPRGEINYDIGTDVRMNSVEDEPRVYEEQLDVTQGKLVIGFRLGECMEEPDKAAVSMFNTVYGAGVTSKLFTNVREKLQLCYYASSMADIHKGFLLAVSGIDFDKYEQARDEILHQLDEMRNGNITDDELAFARAGILSDLKAMQDAPSALESFYIGNILDGYDISPEEYAELVRTVTREDVIAIANSLECDMIYFLKGEDGCEDETPEAAEPLPEAEE